MQGIGRKPGPRSCAGMEHQCVIGLSLPSYFDCRKPVKCARFQSLETAPQGSLPLVRAASRLDSPETLAQTIESKETAAPGFLTPETFPTGIGRCSSRRLFSATPRASGGFQSGVQDVVELVCLAGRSRLRHGLRRGPVG